MEGEARLETPALPPDTVQYAVSRREGGVSAFRGVDRKGEFGGWGLRLSVDRRFGVVLRAGEAIEVTRANGKRFVVTVDDAGTGAALLEALIAARPDRPVRPLRSRP